MMTITLPPDTAARLRDEARRRGLDAAEYARQIIDGVLPKAAAPAPAPAQGAAGPVRDQATIDLLNRFAAEDATDDPEEIARREQELAEFKAAMNRNRLEMEGPLSRKPFP